MLSVAEERLAELAQSHDKRVSIHLYGQSEYSCPFVVLVFSRDSRNPLMPGMADLRELLP